MPAPSKNKMPEYQTYLPTGPLNKYQKRVRSILIFCFASHFGGICDYGLTVVGCFIRVI